MELRIDKAQLQRAIGSAARAAAAKSPMTALTCLVLEASAGKLIARATDTYLGMQVTVPAEVKTDGIVAVDAKRAAEVARCLPAGTVTIKRKDNALEVRAGKSRFKLPILPAEDMPPLPALSEATVLFEVEAEVLEAALIRGSHAAATSEGNMPQLTGALLDCHADHVCVVSADSARMAVATVECNAVERKLVMPARGVSELVKLCGAGTVKVASDGRYVFADTGDTVMSARLIEGGAFPPHDKLIAAACGGEPLSVDRDAIVEVVKRAATMVEDDAAGVLLTLKGGVLTVRAAGAKGEASDAIDVDSQIAAEVLIHPRRLAQALAQSPAGAVDLRPNDGLIRPVQVAGENYVAVLMPMRKESVR